MPCGLCTPCASRRNPHRDGGGECDGTGSWLRNLLIVVPDSLAAVPCSRQGQFRSCANTRQPYHSDPVVPDAQSCGSGISRFCCQPERNCAGPTKQPVVFFVVDGISLTDLCRNLFNGKFKTRSRFHLVRVRAANISPTTREHVLRDYVQGLGPSIAALKFSSGATHTIVHYSLDVAHP